MSSPLPQETHITKNINVSFLMLLRLCTLTLVLKTHSLEVKFTGQIVEESSPFSSAELAFCLGYEGTILSILLDRQRFKILLAKIQTISNCTHDTFEEPVQFWFKEHL